jgi:hypothetical protein
MGNDKYTDIILFFYFAPMLSCFGIKVICSGEIYMVAYQMSFGGIVVRLFGLCILYVSLYCVSEMLIKWPYTVGGYSQAKKISFMFFSAPCFYIWLSLIGFTFVPGIMYIICLILCFYFQKRLVKQIKLALDVQFKIDSLKNILPEEVEKTKNKVYASSTLESTDDLYKVQNLFDRRIKTYWRPKDNGVGEFVVFKIPYGVKGIRIINGLLSEDFKENNRIKKLYIGIITEKLNGNKNYILENLTDDNYNKVVLEDSTAKQDILFDVIKDYKGALVNTWDDESFQNKKNFYLVAGIGSIYTGSKYNNTCISRLEIIR